MFDQLHEECGVFGIFTKDGLDVDVVRETYFALYALQHRGQQSCGIAVNDNGNIMCHKDAGLVPDVFSEMVINHLRGGQSAVGHVRYGSASSPNSRQDAEPMVAKYYKGTIATCFNGNIINAEKLREDLQTSGALFQTMSDAEIINYIIIRERMDTNSIEKAILNAMHVLQGAYSLVILSPGKMIAARDPYGFRPLCIGERDGHYMFASESCALDSLGAHFIRDIEPGEVVTITDDGISSVKSDIHHKTGTCIFESVYFARPDSVIDGVSVHGARKELGRHLAMEHPIEADMVCGVPDSGLDAALGYAEESGIPYGVGFIKNRYIGRTFIQPSQKEREKLVRIKLNVLGAAVKGKRIIMVDDSIVRGTTIQNIIRMLREAGAKEVHVRISSPPFKYPCYFGTDVDSRDKLIANHMNDDEICRHIGADSLGYLSIEDLHQSPIGGKLDFCDGCFTGIYPNGNFPLGEQKETKFND